MTRPHARGATALEKHYALLRWLIPAVEQFPRSQKFVLGDRMQTAALAAMENLTEATYSRRPQAMLTRANLELEKLRLLFRLAYDLRHLDERRYEFAARSVNEVGRMIGGWLNALRGAEDDAQPARAV